MIRSRSQRNYRLQVLFCGLMLDSWFRIRFTSCRRTWYCWWQNIQIFSM